MAATGASTAPDEAVSRIARKDLGFATLDRRDRDHLDFRTVAVWQVKAALEAAFDAGRDARAAEPEHAPDCATPRAATIAGIIAAAVMAGEMSLGGGQPDFVVKRMPLPKDYSDIAPFGLDATEGFRVAGLMISARARASVRTPSHAALSAAEAALALAEDSLDDVPEGVELPDAHAVLASIRDALRAGLAPLHAAEDAGPPGA